jgi:hypothetical protein
MARTAPFPLVDQPHQTIMKIPRHTIIGALAVFCLGLMASHAAFAVKVQTPYMLIMGAIVVFLLHIWNSHRPINRVDIWEMQGDLMAMSGQTMPSRPAITNDALLYLALQQEEMGETADVILKALEKAMTKEDRRRFLNQEATWRWSEMRQTLAGLVAMSESNAQAIRKILKRSRPHDFVLPLTMSEAVDLLDGASDQAVVLAGFGLASGLPAREGYEDVQSSNHSKANPATGKIDKDPSGKWIKGVDYREPCLAAVLRRRYMQADLSDYAGGQARRQDDADDEKPEISQGAKACASEARNGGQKAVTGSPGPVGAWQRGDSVYGNEQPGEHLHAVKNDR